MGLGLAISKQIAELHGGTLSACSEGQGKGSIFTLELSTCAPTPRHSTAGSLSDACDQNVKGIRVLLVEDHKDTGRVLKQLLEQFGYEVCIANSVGSALHFAGNKPFDLVVSDIGLPDGNGLELIRKLRSNPHPFKSVALSGYGMEDDIDKSLEAGFDVHLTKPVDLKKLKEVLDEMFGGGSPE